jgi:hypothetical protein
VSIPPKQLVELCLRLARFKKDNKELLSFLLFDAHNEKGYVESVKQELDDEFADLNKDNLFFAKKSLRRIVRLINKYSKYCNLKESELEMVIHFCENLKSSGIPIHRNKVISNLYQSQLKKLNTLVQSVHEDLQYDYKRQIEAVSL